MRKCRITNFFIVQEQDDYPLQFKVWLGRIATEYKDLAKACTDFIAGYLAL